LFGTSHFVNHLTIDSGEMSF